MGGVFEILFRLPSSASENILQLNLNLNASLRVCECVYVAATFDARLPL